MKSRWAMAVVLVLLAAGSPRYRAQETLSLEGVVLESETDRPLEGVTVFANMTGIQFAGTTDSNGRFKFAISSATPLQ